MITDALSIRIKERENLRRTGVIDDRTAIG